MSKRIVITGPGGSGKDVLMKRLAEKGFVPTVSYTTRPRRKNETDGLEYHFKDYIVFQRMILDKQFWQWKVFRQDENRKEDSWYYGTTWESWKKDDLFILTPPAITGDISPEDRKNTFIIYMDIEENVRRERLSIRQDADDVERRIQADAELFKDFKDFDMRITDPYF